MSVNCLLTRITCICAEFNKWNGSVLHVRHADYEQCGTVSPFLRFADGTTQTTTFEFFGHGLSYFISGSPARCEAGQHMVVRVASCGSPLTTGAEPGLKHRGANLLIPTIWMGHTLLMNNISNEIRGFSV